MVTDIHDHRDRANWFDRHHLGFVNLVLYVFRPHKAVEADHLSYLRPANVHNIDGLWPRPWLYSRVLLLFALAFAVLYWIWTLEGRGESSTLMPGMTVVGALGVPMSMAVFFFECNKFRTVPLLRVFQFMLVGSVVAIAITFLLTLAFDWGMYSSPVSQDRRLVLTARFVDSHPEAVMAISALFEEFGKTLLIFIFMMRYRRRCYILPGMLIGAAVGAGFAVFETAGYASTGGDMLQSEIERSLMAPVCHTAWGAIIGGGTMMIARARLRWRLLLNPKFSLTFLGVGALHFLWNLSIDRSDTLQHNVQLGIVTVFILLLMMWAGVRQIRRFKRLGYLPIARK